MNHSFSCHCAQDERQRFLQDILLQKGYHAVAAELASEQELACNEVLSCKKIILLPVPVSEVMLKKMIPFFSKKISFSEEIFPKILSAIAMNMRLPVWTI